VGRIDLALAGRDRGAHTHLAGHLEFARTGAGSAAAGIAEMMAGAAQLLIDAPDRSATSSRAICVSSMASARWRRV
jgi:hypothetical protein